MLDFSSRTRFDSNYQSSRNIIGLLIFLIVGFSFFVTDAFPLDEKTKPAKEEVKELVLTPDQMKQYASAYKNPSALYIRKVVNNYMMGKFEGYDNYKALKAVDQEYLKNKFIVLSIENALMGGKEISLLSQKRPDKIFIAWVYKASGVYELRAFDAKALSDEEIKSIRIMYKRFLEDRNLAL